MTSPGRRFLVPEVLQSSLMDCGPAALKAVLEGFGIETSYDALRERCQTDVDGTSMDALAELGRELGLDVQHCLVARDSFLLPQARCLPAIVITHSGAGELHFCVVWRTLGRWVQVLDPASGRRWLRWEQLLQLMPDLPAEVSKLQFSRWCQSERAQAPLYARMRALGLGHGECRAQLERACGEDGARRFARLDAGVRMLTALVDSGASSRGRQVERMLRNLLAEESGALCPVPDRYVWASVAEASNKLTLRGAVIVHCQRRAPQRVPDATPLRRPSGGPATDGASAEKRLSSVQGALPPEVLPLLESKRLPVSEILWRTALAGSRTTFAIGLSCVLVGAGLVPLEGLLLQSYLHADRFLDLHYQRALGLTAFVAWALLTLGLELYATSAARAIGRELEARLRIAWLRKLPQLEDRYLQSRSSSDVASRGHSLYLLRELPTLVAQALRAGGTLTATSLGLCWLYPEGALFAFLLVLAGLGVPLLLRRSVVETATRLRTQHSALERFVLDALLGVSPIRVHGAEDAVRRQHETLLAEWARNADALQLQSVGLQGAARGLTIVLAIALCGAYAWRGEQLATLLLCGFWALRVPELAQTLSGAVLSLRSLRGLSLRLVAPLATSELPEPGVDEPQVVAGSARGVRIALERVSALAGGHVLLSELSLHIAPGERIAIVGQSGAGKSTLLGLLLGFIRASEGRLEVDGGALDARALLQLRKQLVWVDPNTRLWDSTVADNLLFTTTDPTRTRLAGALVAAELNDVLAHLPQGALTQLGEAGIRVSGGQGQRVRLGRAFMRPEARLLLLDEPFRGLERERRTALLERLRARFQDATMLYVTHDLEDALDFDRVLVLERGRLVEDGDPRALAANERSRFAELRAAAQALHAELWSLASWRRLQVVEGKVRETRA
jgi:ABC-type bacteriocin/lantibiotic exporter with double-glycine peptidase domain